MNSLVTMNGLVANLMNRLVTILTGLFARLTTRAFMVTRLYIIHEQPGELYQAQHEIPMNNLVDSTRHFNERIMGHESPGSDH